MPLLHYTLSKKASTEASIVRRRHQHDSVSSVSWDYGRNETRRHHPLSYPVLAAGCQAEGTENMFSSSFHQRCTSKQEQSKSGKFFPERIGSSTPMARFLDMEKDSPNSSLCVFTSTSSIKEASRYPSVETPKLSFFEVPYKSSLRNQKERDSNSLRDTVVFLSECCTLEELKTRKGKGKVCSAHKEDESVLLSRTENLQCHLPVWHSSRRCHESHFDREADDCHSKKNTAEKFEPDVTDDETVIQQDQEDEAEVTSLFLSRSGSMDISSSVSLSTQLFPPALTPPSSSSTFFAPPSAISLLREEYHLLNSSFSALFSSRTQ